MTNLSSDIYLITGADPAKKSAFLQRLAACLERDISLVQLRAKQLNTNDYQALAQEVIALCHRYEATILLNCDDISLVTQLNADGIQLSSANLFLYNERPLPKNKMVAASCHSAEELLHAEKIAVDFVTLSPILSTSSHPDAQLLGWDNFAKLTSRVKTPVFALGGVSTDDLDEVKKRGGHGVAAISAIWYE